MPQLYITDDNSEFAAYLSTVAVQEGWTVETCENGRVLVDRLTRGSGPAFLLVDINMPDMDGIEAIEGISTVNRALRIRFITGGSDTSIIAAKLIAQARSLHVGRNIFKPIALQVLKDMLRTEAGNLSALDENPSTPQS